MILPFSTKYKNGTPNYFIEKIWAGIVQENLIPTNEIVDFFKNVPNEKKHFLNKITCDDLVKNPKIHTLRIDESNRWHRGRKIHPVIFNRSKNQFQFTPVLGCKNTQRIFITPSSLTGFFEVSIEGKQISPLDIRELAINDGFESWQQMEEWFFPDGCKHDELSGKIIHWTDFKY